MRRLTRALVTCIHEREVPYAYTNMSTDIVVVDSLLIVTPIVGFCNCSMFCCALLCVQSSFAIILKGKRELVALLCSSS